MSPAPIRSPNFPNLPQSNAYSALDWLSTIVLICGADGTIRAVNAAAEDELGVSRADLIGSAVGQLFVEYAPLYIALEELAQGIVDTKRLDAQLTVIGSARFDGNHTSPAVQVFVTRTASPGELLIEVVAFEQQVKQEREERISELVLANKELIRNLAHEIKNPLGGIRGSAQLLQMELADRGELAEYTQVIISEADRLQTLVDRLLAPHRKAQMVGDVNIHEVLERVRSLILAEFPLGIAVLRDYDISLPEFRGDKEQIIQAVLNIAHNAAQVLAERMQRGDALITLQTRIARQVTFGRNRHRLALDLHIIDNGPGIAADIRDRIFFPLVTGREGGSGLGLTLAQTFVQQHDGVIECESVPGRTDFRILIPLY